MTSNRTILATPEQREKEELAIRLLASAPVQKVLAEQRAAYAEDALSKKPDARATIDRATGALATTAAYLAAIGDADRPVIMWSTNAEHEWMGLSVPHSGYGLDNPDNVYRMSHIDGDARYEVRGSFGGYPLAQQTMVVFPSIPGLVGSMNAQGHMRELGGVQSDTMVVDPDGSFLITIDPDPAGDRPNHIQTDGVTPGLHLLVRDSMMDWNAERPTKLDIKRVDGVPPRPVPDEAALAERAAEILSQICPYWQNWIQSHVHDYDAKPLNAVIPPWMRVTGWGFTQTGSFAFDDDSVWVVTLHPLGARYFNFQLSDPWGVAREYVHKIGSLNGYQAQPNADGSYTFVISDKDPGVYNWLDTDGLHSGTFQMRWQAIPQGLKSTDGSVLGAAIVKRADLRDALPPETRFVNADERKAQIAERAESYATRLS